MKSVHNRCIASPWSVEMSLAVVRYGSQGVNEGKNTISAIIITCCY
jgi:hypothetical protein